MSQIEVPPKVVIFQAVSTQIRPCKVVRHVIVAKSAFLSQFDVLNKNRDFPSVRFQGS